MESGNIEALLLRIVEDIGRLSVEVENLKEATAALKGDSLLNKINKARMGGFIFAVTCVWSALVAGLTAVVSFFPSILKKIGMS